jgi:hypothetical protein
LLLLVSNHGLLPSLSRERFKTGLLLSGPVKLKTLPLPKISLWVVLLQTLALDKETLLPK